MSFQPCPGSCTQTHRISRGDQQVKGSCPSPLLCPGEARSGARGPVLGSPIQEGQGLAAEGVGKEYKGAEGDGTSL